MARYRSVPVRPPRPAIVVRRHFGPRDRVIIEGVEYRCVETDDDGHLFQTAHEPPVCLPVRHEELPAIEDRPDYRHDRDWYEPGEAKARLHAGTALLTHLSAKERGRVLWRFDFASEFLRLEETDPTVTRGDGSVVTAIAKIDATLAERGKAVAAGGRRRRTGRGHMTFDPPGPKALLVWVNKLAEGNLNPLALRDDYRKCGNHTPRLSEEQDELVEELCDRWLVPRQPSIREVHRQIEAELSKRNAKRVEEGKPPLTMPSYGVCLDAVKKFPKFEVVACRRGIEAAMKKFRPVGEGILDVYRPFQHCEMDHWSVQLHVLCKKAGVWDTLTEEEKAKVEKARYQLGLVICRRTRCIAALRLTRTATEQSALELLEMAVTDKAAYAKTAGASTPWDIHGTMGWLFADGAFATWELKAALGVLGINFEIPPSGLAHMRGTIERAFRMMHQGVVAQFDGRTFSNIIEKGDYNSEARAGNTIDELAIALVRYAVDVHHNTPHPSLGFETPRECWLRLTKELGVDPSPDWHKQRHVFGIDLKRTLGPAGLRWLNVQYRSARLHEHFKQHGVTEMDVRVHEANMGAVSVQVDGGWLSVPAPPEFHKMPAATWIGAEADLRRRGYRTAEITAPIRHAAMRAFGDLREVGHRRIGIDDGRMTAQELLRAERQMTIGASFPDDEPAHGGGDLYDGALQTGQAALPAADAAPPTTGDQSPAAPENRGKPKRWKLED